MSRKSNLGIASLYIVEDTSSGRRWGFPGKEDLDREISYLEERVKEMGDKFEHIDFGGPFIIKGESDVMKYSERLNNFDAFLVFMLVGGAPAYAEIAKIYKAYGYSLEALWGFGKPMIIFVRAEGERVYDGNFRAISFLGEHLVEADRSLWVVINDWIKLEKILKAMEALKRIKGLRIIAVGPPVSALGSYEAMREVIKKFGINVIIFPFDYIVKEYSKAEDVDEIVQKFFEGSEGLIEFGEREAREEAVRAAKLYLTFKKLMMDKGADVITFNCYEGGLTALKETAPCFALMRINDEGKIGVCESDFAAMAAMLLARYVADKPSFLGDIVVIPEKNQLLLAHCSSPTKLRGFGEKAEPYLAAPQYETGRAMTAKVLMGKGEVVTVIAPSLDLSRFALIRGKIVESPNLPICRTQVLVQALGDLGDLLKKAFFDIHWILVFGDYVDELDTALKILGIDVIKIG